MYSNKRMDRVYDLSFVPPKPSEGRTRSEIVITVLPRYAEVIDKQLESAQGMEEAFVAWCAKFQLTDVQWRSTADLFSSQMATPFGLNGCALRSADDQEVRYRFPLNPATCLLVALTLHAFVHALEYCLYNPALQKLHGSNFDQLMHVRVGWRPDIAMTAGYGHPLMGFVAPPLRAWLVKVAADPERLEEVENRLAHVIRTAWLTGKPKKKVDPYDQTFVNITDDGRFILQCFGNACDVAIYPDHCSDWESGYATEFNCHNLDAPLQQLTLLAGLATLHELAAKDLG